MDHFKISFYLISVTKKKKKKYAIEKEDDLQSIQK